MVIIVAKILFALYVFGKFLEFKMVVLVGINTLFNAIKLWKEFKKKKSHHHYLDDDDDHEKHIDYQHSHHNHVHSYDHYEPFNIFDKGKHEDHGWFGKLFSASHYKDEHEHEDHDVHDPHDHHVYSHYKPWYSKGPYVGDHDIVYSHYKPWHSK